MHMHMQMHSNPSVQGVMTTKVRACINSSRQGCGWMHRREAGLTGCELHASGSGLLPGRAASLQQQVCDSSVVDVEPRLSAQQPLHGGLVEGAVHLRPWAAHCRSLGRVQHPELDPCLVRRPGLDALISISAVCHWPRLAGGSIKPEHHAHG